MRPSPSSSTDIAGGSGTWSSGTIAPPCTERVPSTTRTIPASSGGSPRSTWSGRSDSLLRPDGELADRVDDSRPGSLRYVVPHAVDQEESRAGNGRRGSLAGLDGNERIVHAMDYERRR